MGQARSRGTLAERASKPKSQRRQNHSVTQIATSRQLFAALWAGTDPRVKIGPLLVDQGEKMLQELDPNWKSTGPGSGNSE